MPELKRKRGDRYDAYRVRKVDPFFLLIPYIMKTRVDSQVYFEDEVEITHLEQFVREHSETDIPNLKLYQVVFAAIIRLYSQRPYLNRYCMHGRLYARKDMRISMAIRRGGGDDSLTTTIKPSFALDDTLYQVVEKFNAAVEQNRQTEANNGTDKTANAIGSLPGFLPRGVVRFLTFLDHHGHLPKVIHEVSPFHTSLFLTNMGSLGVEPIYHHIYEFGTTSVFVAIGRKKTVYVNERDGSIRRKRVMGIKVVADERICDGHYYATSMRMLAKLLRFPDQLLTPPEQVVLDDGIDMKGRL